MKRGRCFAIAVVASLVTVGCGNSPVTTIPPPATTPPTSFPMAQQFRIVNGSPGTGIVDVYIYEQGAARPATPTFANVPSGTITPFTALPAGLFNMDVLRAGAVPTSVAIATAADVTQQTLQVAPPTPSSPNYSLVIEGTALNGTRAIESFNEPYEQPGESALVIHHTSPAANLLTLTNPIGVGVYSATKYPPASSSAAIALADTRQLFAFSFIAGNQTVPLPNMSVGGYIFLTPFPAAPLPTAVGFALGLPNASSTANAPLKSVIAAEALSQTAPANTPYANQRAIAGDAAETIGAGTHVSEFLVDADQNGNIGLIGSLDP